MDAKYYDQGELSIGNPPLVELVRELGSKNLPENAPTTLSAMAYEMARGGLERYLIIQKMEIRLVRFSKGLQAKDEAEDNHVVNLVLQRRVEKEGRRLSFFRCSLGDNLDGGPRSTKGGMGRCWRSHLDQASCGVIARFRSGVATAGWLSSLLATETALA
jgi:hypothetical protein